MELESIIAALEQNRKVFRETLVDTPLALIQWKHHSKDWSLLEIICHLVDEEKEDFRTRIDQGLQRPGNPLKPIDPAGWVKSRDYKGQDFEKKLQQFDKERQISIAWLKTTADLNWDNTVLHAEYGSMTARSLLHNWLAHDYHHIRQINRVKYNFLKQNSSDSLEYAGDW